MLAIAHQRDQLKVLDACLAELESANQRGEEILSRSLAAKLRAHVPDLVHGIPISQALNTVFEAQQPYLRRQAENRSADSRHDLHRGQEPHVSLGAPVNATLSKSEAEALTNRIKKSLKDLCPLLCEAHARRAWSSLGYRSWEQYVRHEFGMSRSRSYEILEQGRVLRAIQEAAGLTRLPDLSPYAALQVKPHLVQVIAEVQRRLRANRAPIDIDGVVSEVVDAARKDWKTTARPSGWGNGPTGRGVQDHDTGETDNLRASISVVDPNGLRQAVTLLASLPRAAECLAQIPSDQRPDLTDVRRASSWLNDFIRVTSSPDGFVVAQSA